MQGCNKKIIHCNMLKIAYKQEYCTEIFNVLFKGCHNIEINARKKSH